MIVKRFKIFKICFELKRKKNKFILEFCSHNLLQIRRLFFNKVIEILIVIYIVLHNLLGAKSLKKATKLWL